MFIKEKKPGHFTCQLVVSRATACGGNPHKLVPDREALHQTPDLALVTSLQSSMQQSLLVLVVVAASHGAPDTEGPVWGSSPAPGPPGLAVRQGLQVREGLLAGGQGDR